MKPFAPRHRAPAEEEEEGLYVPCMSASRPPRKIEHSVEEIGQRWRRTVHLKFKDPEG